MSKRRLFGLSKWRLGKLEGDYKTHKRNKKNLNYLEEEKVPTKSKKKYPCKKLKGDHKFEYTDLQSKYFKELKCIACGKKNLEWGEDF